MGTFSPIMQAAIITQHRLIDHPVLAAAGTPDIAVHGAIDGILTYAVIINDVIATALREIYA